MALVSIGYALSVNLIDTSGSISTLQYDLQATTFAEANTEAGNIIAELDPITSATIAGYRVTQVYTEDALTLPANSENAVKAELSVRLAGVGNKRAILRIPSPAASIFVAGSGAGFNIVDTADADVLAYVALFELGNSAYLSDGETVVIPASQAIDSGRRISVRSRNP